MNRILSLIPILLIGANVFASKPASAVLKWDVSIATPDRQGLVTLTPGTAVTLERGKTNDVFAIFGAPVPESEEAHKAVSLEFRFRFLQGTSEVTVGTIHADQRGTFIPAHHPVKPCDSYRPASQELYSTESITVPAGADSLEIERVAIDDISGKTNVYGPIVFALVGIDKSLIVASGNSRGDTATSPKPYVLGGPITSGKPLSALFDEYRAMNAWVRTAPSEQGHGFTAPYSAADIRTKTCINKDAGTIYYAAWAELPLFEIATRIRFDQGDWHELPTKKLYPAWGSPDITDVVAFPFDTVPGIFRSADPYVPKTTATIFPETASDKLARLSVQNIVVPAHTQTLSVQTRIHAYLIAHYGNFFKLSAAAYVGDDCIKVYAEGQRVELEDLWDTPDFTSATAWTYQVN